MLKCGIGFGRSRDQPDVTFRYVTDLVEDALREVISYDGKSVAGSFHLSGELLVQAHAVRQHLEKYGLKQNLIIRDEKVADLECSLLPDKGSITT